MLNELANKENRPTESLVKSLKSQLYIAKAKINKLTDAYLEGVFEIEEFQEKKNSLMREKRDIEEKIDELQRKGDRWLELTKRWILEANQAQNIAFGENFAEMQNFLKKVGSNRKIINRRLIIEFKKPWDLIEKWGEIRPKQNRGEATA
ncbi:MAG: hypothetical protein WC926_01875, partial [Candidatus Paceibacterota bacterium]